MRHPHPLPPAFTYTLSEPTIRLMSLNTPYARHVLSKKTHARVSYLYSRDPIWRLSAHSWLTPELSAISRWGDGTRYLGWTSRNEPPIDLPIAFTQVAVLDTRTRFYIYSYHVWQNSISAPVKPTECLHNH